jgi:hypothetical protein
MPYPRSESVIGPAKKVVARYADGKLVKGYTYDFARGRRRFHVFTSRDASGELIPILLGDLKAVFFVRDLAGNPRYDERKQFADADAAPGRRVEVTFKDGEVLIGFTESEIYAAPEVYVRPGLFFTPADAGSNNLRVYAVTGAVRRFRYLPKQPAVRRPVRGAAHRPPLPRRILAWLVRPISVSRPIPHRSAR